MMVVPSQRVSVTGSSTLIDLSSLADSTEKMPTSPFRPPMAAYSPSTLIDDAAGTGIDSVAIFSNEATALVVTQPLGTGRFLRALDSLRLLATMRGRAASGSVLTSGGCR